MSFLGKGKNHVVEAAIFGVHQPPGNKAGRVVVYGDLNCIDSSHMVAPCSWLLLEFMDYASNNVLSTMLKSMTHEVTGNDPLSSRTLEQRVQLKPTRRTESNKVMVEVASKVLKGGRVGDSCFRASESRK